MSVTVDPVELLATPIGRRERKRNATRDRLRTAGLTLFATRGFTATTVRDITDDADVAERTFYRHFESKEALLLDDLRRYFAAASELVASRPAGEAPMASLVVTVHELQGEWTVADDQMRFLAEVVMSNDAARGHLHKLVDEHQEELAATFARRRNLDTADYRCHLEAAVAGLAFNQAIGRFIVDDRHTIWDYGLEAIRLLAAGSDPAAVADIPALVE